MNRPDGWFDDFRTIVERYLSGEVHDGWEPREQVVARFSAAVHRAMSSSVGEDTIVVNHGQALTLFLAYRVPLDVVGSWRALTFPDAWALELETGELSHIFETGLGPPDA